MEKDIATGMTKVRHPQYRGYDELLDDVGNKVYRDQKTKEYVECVSIDVPAGGKYLTQKQLEAQAAYRERSKESESRELRRVNHGPLGKFYLSACRTDQFEGLNPQDITRLIFLASHLNYKSVLMLNERRKMTLNDLSEVLGVSDSTARRLWANVGNRYIVQMDDGSLIVKDTFFRGKQKHIR